MTFTPNLKISTGKLRGTANHLPPVPPTSKPRYLRTNEKQKRKRKKLIYGFVDYGEGERIVILNRYEAEEILSALKASKSHTWGEFRRSCPKKYLDGVLEDVLQEDGELPEDDELFSSGRIPGYDYDWPRYASGLYGEVLPEEIVEHHKQSFNWLVIHTPLFVPKHHRNMAISVPTVSGG